MITQPILSTNEYYALQGEARERYIQDLIQTYRERGGELKERRIEFIRSNMQHPSGHDVLTVHTFFMASHAIGIGGASACIGAAIGAAVGGPAAPATAVVGAALGAAIGGPIGAILGIGTGYAVAEYKCRPTYKKFCERESNKEFHSKLKDMLNEERIFDELICNISKMPVIEGVRTPAGHLYEKAVIEVWIDKNGTDPMTRKPLTHKDLKPAVHTSAKSATKFIKFLLAKRNETLNIAPEIAEGYDALIEDTREAFIIFYQQKFTELQKKLRSREISYEEFTETNKKLQNRYLNLV